MFKLPVSESRNSNCDRNEIGSSINANQLVYASMNKHVKENDKLSNKQTKVYQVKCIYTYDYYSLL